jgi:hypothetical protein
MTSIPTKRVNTGLSKVPDLAPVLGVEPKQGRVSLRLARRRHRRLDRHLARPDRDERQLEPGAEVFGTGDETHYVTAILNRDENFTFMMFPPLQ